MDYHTSPFDDPVSAVVGLCLLIVLLPLVFVAYFTIGRFTTIFLVLLSVGAVRLLFGDTFTVEVKQGRTAHWETRAGNWRASGKVIREKAEEIRNGTPPERNIL